MSKFTADCRSKAYGVLTAWVNDLSIREVDCPRAYHNRHYRLYASHSWGTAYCDWRDDGEKLKAALKEAGAVNIICKCEYNNVQCFFDMSKKLQKELNKVA